jgi:cell division protein FtsW
MTPKTKQKKLQSSKKVDPYILGTVLVLLVAGLIAVSSASAVLSFERFGNNNYYFFRQLLFAGLGLIAMFIFSKIDYHFWRKWATPIMLGAVVLLIVVLVPKIGVRSGTVARSWFFLGSFGFQPSELAKLAIIFYLAAWFERKKDAENNFWFGVLPPLFVAGGALALVVLEPDLGTTIILGAIIMILLFAAGTKLRYLGGLVAAAGAALWFLIVAAPYRAQRIVTFFDPTLDPRGSGYQINQALLAIGSGGFWGYGFGASRQKHNYLPQPIGDSIFAVMAEELGFSRVIFVVLIFALLIFSSLRLAKKAPDKFGQLVTIGITGWIGVQALINIGAIIGLVPLTGVPLPFISYGGSALLAICGAVGVLLNISKQRL